METYSTAETVPLPILENLESQEKDYLQDICDAFPTMVLIVTYNPFGSMMSRYGGYRFLIVNHNNIGLPAILFRLC